MPYDLNILCVAQKRKTRYVPFRSIFGFQVHHRHANSLPKYYDKKWCFMNSCYGFWYNLLLSDTKKYNPLLGCYPVCELHTNCDSISMPKNQFLPDTLNQFPENFTQFVSIKNRFRRGFEKILDFFLSESPVGMVIFLARYGNGSEKEEKELVTGVISRNSFFEMLYSNRIVFNMCYVIKN